MNVPRAEVIQRLRQAGYYYTKKRGKHTELWRRRGSVDRVFVSLRDVFDEQLIVVTLGQAGLSPQDIKDFLAQCTKS